MDGTRFLPGNAEQDSTDNLCLELRAGGARTADMGAGEGLSHGQGRQLQSYRSDQGEKSG